MTDDRAMIEELRDSYVFANGYSSRPGRREAIEAEFDQWLAKHDSLIIARDRKARSAA